MVLSSLFGWLHTGTGSSKPKRGSTRLALESLEVRTVPTASAIAPQWFKNAALPAITPAVANLQRSQWIVELKPAQTATLRTVDDAAKFLKVPGTRIDVIMGLGEQGVFLVRGFGNPAAIKNTIERLPSVASISTNNVVRATEWSNDPESSKLWGLNNQGQVINGVAGTPDADIDLPEALAHATIQTQVVVGIVDTGIDYNHPDLRDNMWKNPGEIAGNNRDDDGNGFIDDVYGFNFVNNTGNPMDDDEHGTHVAGTIAASLNNSQGVAGIASGAAKLMAIKFLDANGSGTYANAIRALNYATMMSSRGVNLKVLNNSWGGYGTVPALEDAVNATNAAGMLFVASAGNESNDNDGEFKAIPASYAASNIISVAATNNLDELVSFSNYGATTVDLAAPGVGILSTTPGNRYQSFNGTSMAAPHVAGALALAWACHPDKTSTEIQDALFGSVDALDSLDGAVATGGRLNVNNLLTALEDPILLAPLAPANLVVTDAGTDFIVLEWTDSSDNEESFSIEISADGGETWDLIGILELDTTTARIAGLESGSTYQFKVYASNSVGDSDSSNIAEAATLPLPEVPAGPSDLTVDGIGSQFVDLSWFDESDNEDSFLIEISRNGGNTWESVMSLDADSTEARVGGLASATSYQFRVVAQNQVGRSEASNIVNARTTGGIPQAPGNVRPDNVWSSKVDVAWDDRSNNESGFRILVSSNGGSNWIEAGVTEANATRFRVEGLDPEKTYVFGVRAINGNEASAIVRSRSVLTAPPAPTEVRPDNVWARTIDLAWNQVSRTESSFRVYSSINGGASWALVGTADANATRFRITNLTPATTYQFVVRAAGSEGLSELSNIATISTQVEVPPPPAPTNPFTRVSVSDVGRTSFRFNWRFNGPTPNRFEVYIEARGTWQRSENVPADRTSALIEFERSGGPRLRAGESYRVKIRAIDPSGRASDWSEILTVRMGR
ncbi:MAG: S8 family serine peptidase [Planctomycetota bacterium]|nr:S8 family serine peptidase [Planctomycetota bacterium]